MVIGQECHRLKIVRNMRMVALNFKLFKSEILRNDKMRRYQLDIIY